MVKEVKKSSTGKLNNRKSNVKKPLSTKKGLSNKKTTTKKKTQIKKKPASKKINTQKDPNKTLKKSNETLLIENFVSLQKVMTNLSIRFSELSQNISKMLFVFEEAAKNLAQSEKVMDEKFGEKVDNLLEQNKGITRNLNLMDERIRRQGMVKPSNTSHHIPPQNNNLIKSNRQIQSTNLNSKTKAPEIKAKTNSPTPQKMPEEKPTIKAPESLPQI